jgi:predicted nuclease of predicted toxin-antitoxin system
MRILVDENIPLMTIAELRDRQYDVKDIRGTQHEGISDTELWQIAQQENRLLITTDKWFRQYRNLDHSGVLIVCLRQPNRYRIHKRIIHAFDRFSETDWQGATVTMRDMTISVTPRRLAS